MEEKGKVKKSGIYFDTKPIEKSENAVLSGGIFNSIKNITDTIESMEEQIIWTNPDTNINFNRTELNIDYTKYKYLRFVFISEVTQRYYIYYEMYLNDFINIDNLIKFFYVQDLFLSGKRNQRTIDLRQNNKIIFTSGVTQQLGVEGETVDNSVVIPCYIIGIEKK